MSTANCSQLQRTAPYSFYCYFSGNIMENPCLADCGHLFDGAQINRWQVCPTHKIPLTSETTLPLPQLAQKIEHWKKNNFTHALASNVEDTVSKFKECHLQQSPKITKQEIGPICTVVNAHQDDIHGFILSTDETFISGSKDNTIKLWDTNGTELQTLKSSYSIKPGYRYWVTALAAFRNGFFASGTRDGYISLWDNRRIECDVFEYSPSKGSKNKYFCKERNKARINCIKEPHIDDEHSNCFFTGTPKYIQLWNPKTGRILKYWHADDNDWVYCIEPLKKDSLIAVIGSRMELWAKIYSKQPFISSLIKESSKDNQVKQRPHISAIVRLKAHPSLLPSALFDGSVRVVNLEAQKVTHFFQEHVGRVWSVIEMEPNIVLSSADDKTIKIWDLRNKSSVATIGENPGRVSSLLKIKENVFISGSCPDDIKTSEEKASIRFWDIRQILKG